MNTDTAKGTWQASSSLNEVDGPGSRAASRAYVVEEVEDESEEEDLGDEDGSVEPYQVVQRPSAIDGNQASMRLRPRRQVASTS